MSIAAMTSPPRRRSTEPFGPDRTRSRNHLEVVPSSTDRPLSRPVPASEIHVDDRPGATAILFGSFCLLPARRLLLEGDQPVRIGSRALEILIALVEHHGELLSKNALMQRVWPDTTVVEANLSVHIAALRRALRDGCGENRYLVNMPGRGYRFVAPVTFAEDRELSPPKAAATQLLHDLPARPTPLISRDDAIKEHGVWLVDLAQIADPRQVPHAVAAALGFDIRPEQTLLVLDNGNVRIFQLLHQA
jgi:DNA-binding winged helix-turn-helix (wHTH) protein